MEPASSAVLSTGAAGTHQIQGIGAGFIPDVLNTKVYDEIITVQNEDAFAMGKLIGKSEGVLVEEFPQVRRPMLQSSLQSARKTKEKQLLFCFLTRATDICLHRCLQNKARIL